MNGGKSMNKNIDFEKLHRTVLNKLADDNYALCRNNAPYNESEMDLYKAIANRHNRGGSANT
ncbi:hypothetical protein AALC75_01815 [Lachnospiraceae bacterium 48-42]|nr:hypothetical protein [Dorea sp.]